MLYLEVHVRFLWLVLLAPFSLFSFPSLAVCFASSNEAVVQGGGVGGYDGALGSFFFPLRTVR